MRSFRKRWTARGNIEALKTAAETKTKIVGADLIGAWKGDVTEKTTPAGRDELAGKFKVTNQSPQQGDCWRFGGAFLPIDRRHA